MHARSMMSRFVALVGLLAAGCATDQAAPTAEARQAPASTGKPRLCVLADGDSQARREPPTGELTGPAIDVGWALARRLDVPFQAAVCKTAALTDGRVAERDWDVMSGRADAVAARTSSLLPASEEVQGTQLLEGRVALQPVALGVPKGRQAAAHYVARFVDELKASGYVRASIERASVPGLTAAP